MAVDKKSIIAAVAVLNPVDMRGVSLAFPVEYTHDTQKVTFDRYEAGSEIALKGSFLTESNVVQKDGFETVTVNPMQVNESIVDSPANFSKKRIGQTEYGTPAGLSDADRMMIENEMMGFGKLKLRGERLKKLSAYQVLVTGKVTVSKNGVATDEIDYGLTDVVTNSGTTGAIALWTSADAYPVDQLVNESIAKGKYAFDTVILGADAEAAFSANPNVRTTDDTTSGKMKNFEPATDAAANAKSTDTLIFLGTTVGKKRIDVYVELDQYNDGSSDLYYMSEKYAVCFKRDSQMNGQIQYGAIPVAEKRGTDSEIVAVQGKEWMDSKILEDPAGIKRYYRTSPLATMNVPKAFKSIKTVA
jgi:hypothetical protein